MPDIYDMALGLPHTNYRGLSESLMLMHAGNFQWASIATAIGTPLSRLRTISGGEVYAAFFYIEERIPAAAPLESFKLDDVMRFVVRLRAFKNITVEGRIVFGHQERMTDLPQIEAELDGNEASGQFGFIRFGNVFITPVKGNSVLQVAPPTSGDFSRIPPLSNADNPYHMTKAASDGRGLGLLDDSWEPVLSHQHTYTLDVDRDTNGAGLVYFANYVSFMATAERLALSRMEKSADDAAMRQRSLRHRRVAYYGNVNAADTIDIRVTALRNRTKAEWIGLQYLIQRQQDQQTICLSEAIKFVPVIV
jgi:probable biosynthetic protein (TIGR04098 family)